MSNNDEETNRVSSIAVMKDGKLLMGQRRDNQRWTLVGGHVDPNEGTRQAAVRELKEEAGLNAKTSDLEFLGSDWVSTKNGRKKIHAYKLDYNKSKRPNVQNDPDEEVHRWRWIECDGDEFKDICKKLHSPKNIVLQKLGLMDSKYNLKKNVPEGYVYAAADGDGIGNKVEAAAMKEDISEIRLISSLIEKGSDIIREYAEHNGGEVIIQGGDDVSMVIPKSRADVLEEVREKYYDATGFTVTMGVGNTMKEGVIALMWGKLHGKDQLVYFTPEKGEEIERLKERASLTQEEKILDSGILGKSEKKTDYLKRKINKYYSTHFSDEAIKKLDKVSPGLSPGPSMEGGAAVGGQNSLSNWRTDSKQTTFKSENYNFQVFVDEHEIHNIYAKDDKGGYIASAKLWKKIEDGEEKLKAGMVDVNKNYDKEKLAKSMYDKAEKHFGKKIINNLGKGPSKRWPITDQPSEQEKGTIEQWQEMEDPSAREAIPPIMGARRQRALHKLHRSTDVRKDPKTNKREFLLHRGMAGDEYNKSYNPQDYSLNHGSHTSWTPNKTVAEIHADKVDGTVASAWVPEDKIHHVPKQLGGNKEKSPYAFEHEVIVKPDHESKVHIDDLTEHHLPSVNKSEKDDRIDVMDLKRRLEDEEKESRLIDIPEHEVIRHASFWRGDRG